MVTACFQDLQCSFGRLCGKSRMYMGRGGGSFSLIPWFHFLVFMLWKFVIGQNIQQKRLKPLNDEFSQINEMNEIVNQDELPCGSSKSEWNFLISQFFEFPSSSIWNCLCLNASHPDQLSSFYADINVDRSEKESLSYVSCFLYDVSNNFF